MNLKLRNLTLEHTLFGLALALALWLRFLNLGAAPLTDAEAGWALQALQIAHRGLVDHTLVIGPQPAYILLTGAAFTLFESTNFLARFWPALAGASLVLLPLFFRRYLGPTAALILAFGLALDPGLVAVSRTAGSPMMAVSFTFLTLALWHARRSLLAGVFAGLALLSGPAVFQGALILLLVWLAAAALGGLPAGLFPHPGSQYERERSLRQAVLACGGTLLLTGTLLFSQPTGLAAWFEALPVYLQGWLQPSGVPALRLVFTLLVYQLLALIFALIGILRLPANSFRISAQTSEYFTPEDLPSPAAPQDYLPLLLWVIFGLLVVLLYPARQVADLVWVLAPLWALAGIELARHLPGEDQLDNWIAAGYAIFVVVLMALFWLNLLGVVRAAGDIQIIRARLGIMAGITGLIVLTAVLIAYGWSLAAGRRGLVWGVSVSLGTYLFASMWGASQIRSQATEELWYNTPMTGQEILLLDTLGDLSEWETGFRNTIDVQVTADSPALDWALRDFTKIQHTAEPAAGSLPSILITPDAQQAPKLAASYRGQDFVWWEETGWAGVLPPDPLRWLAYREAPTVQGRIILWARADLFPGGNANIIEGETESQIPLENPSP